MAAGASGYGQLGIAEPGELLRGPVLQHCLIPSFLNDPGNEGNDHDRSAKLRVVRERVVGMNKGGG